MLSFENLLFVEIYLPELFHLVILLFSTGPYLMRSIIHGLVINIVHSLYTSVATADDKLQSLRFFELRGRTEMRAIATLAFDTLP